MSSTGTSSSTRSADQVREVSRRAAWVVFASTARRAARSGLLWGIVFGLVVAETAAGYAKSFPTQQSRANLAVTYESNLGLSSILGTARDLDTVAGYTAWHAMGILSVLGAIWGLLLATRLSRGEEDAGRWELLLSGQTTRRRAAIQAMAGVAVGLLVLWAITAVSTIAVGGGKDVDFTIGASLYLATSVVVGAALFAATGVVTAQLAPSRRQANTIGAALLGAAYLLRMMADSGAGIDWLRWVSPLGWSEELRPLADPRPVLFLPIVAFIAVAVGASATLAGRRDLSASALPVRDAPQPRTSLLAGQFGLTARLTRPLFLAWVIGLAACGLMFGVAAQAGTGAVTESKAIEHAIERLGGEYGGTAAYLGISFLLGAGLVAFAAAGQITATRAEEAEGYVEHLLVRPVSRWRWLAGRLLSSAALVLTAGVVAGMTGWLGTASQDGDLSFGRLVLAGVNIVPPALFILGVGALVYGVRPRLAAPVAYALVAWSFVIQLIASGVKMNQWVLDTSVLAHIAPAPATDPNWVAAAWLTGLGLLAAVVGVLGFRRRDLVGA